jgi:hypothetical protein
LPLSELHPKGARDTVRESRIAIMDFDADNPLAVEIQQEMAASYFAACKKMVDSLDALKTFDRELASSTPSKAQATRRIELLEAAAERVYFVVIQREAIKLSRSDELFKDYEVPEEVRLRMGRSVRSNAV